MTAPMRFPRFFVTSLSPCPYLPNRSERKVFTELKGENASALNDALGRIGFRRSQAVAYRPSCDGCQACVSVRVLAQEFLPSTAQKRNLKRNGDLIATICRPWSTIEQYELLQRYLQARHPDGGMAKMDEGDYAEMIEQSPVTTYMVEYREPSWDGVTPGRLVGACLTDQQNDGLSMVYSFYETEDTARAGLGNYIILDHIRQADAAQLPYVYLGYWVEGSPSMHYKVRYRPLERLGHNGWERISVDEQDRLVLATPSAEVRTFVHDEASCSASSAGVTIPASTTSGCSSSAAETTSKNLFQFEDPQP